MTFEEKLNFPGDETELAPVSTGLDAMRAGNDHDAHGPSPLRRLRALIKLEHDDVWVAIVYAIGVGLLSLATPLAVQVLVNTVAFGALVQPLAVITTMVLAGLVFAVVLRALQAYVVERIQQRVFTRVALDLAQRLPQGPLDARGETDRAELMNRFFDVMTVQKSAATMLIDGVSVVLQTLVGTLLLAFYHPFLLAFDVILLASIGFVIFVLGYRAIPTAIKESKAKYAFAAWLQESARHVETFKFQGGHDLVQRRLESLTRDYLESRNKHFSVAFRQLLGALVVQALASAALLGVGGWLVLMRQLTLGQLVAAELIVTAVVAGFSKLGKYCESFYDLVAAVDKIGHMIDPRVERSGGLLLPPSDAGFDVRATGLVLRKDIGDPMDAFDLWVPASTSLCLVGKSGSGKSVLVDALLGIRPHHGGRLDINGISIDELCLSALRREVALVRVDGLFAATIDDNIRLGRHDISRHEVRLALEGLGIWESVSSLADGLDTEVATYGKGLPSELGHLVLVARAIVTRPRLLVLDGIFDALGPSARAAVRRVVFAPNAPWSLIVTTADVEVASSFAQRYVIEGARLIVMPGASLQGGA